MVTSPFEEEVSLEGCFDRIKQARVHLDRLNEEINTFMKSDPCEVTVIETNVKERYQIISLKAFKETPNSWAITVGEVGYNLRSALDHLVYELALWNNSSPEADRTQFPIFLKFEDYWNKRGKRPSWRDAMLKGVAEQHRAMIDKLQPYQHGRSASRTAVAQLAWFSDKDKHRIHHPSVLTIFGVRYRVVGPGLTQSEVYLPYDGDPIVKRTKDKTEVMLIRVAIKSRIPGGQVNMNNGDVKVGIGFGDRLLQLPNFYWTVDQIETVVQRFGPTIGR
jgi:hypothetical protein